MERKKRHKSRSTKTAQGGYIDSGPVQYDKDGARSLDWKSSQPPVGATVDKAEGRADGQDGASCAGSSEGVGQPHAGSRGAG